MEEHRWDRQPVKLNKNEDPHVNKNATSTAALWVTSVKDLALMANLQNGEAKLFRGHSSSINKEEIGNRG